MRDNVLPTLPLPGPLPGPTPPDPYDVPPDIGTGQAGFVFACLVLIITLAMGILAISQLKSASGLTVQTLDRAAAAHMEPPQARTIGASTR